MTRARRLLRLAGVGCLVAATLGAARAQSLEGRLKTIAETGTIRLAYRADANPFSFVDAQGQPAGYTVELCQRVAKSIERQLGLAGLVVAWVRGDIRNRFELVASNRADMECGSSTVTLSRMKEVDFSTIVFAESTGVLVKAQTGLSLLGDFAGKKIAVITGTTNERALREQLQRRQLNAAVVVVNGRQDGIAALEDGRVDGFASDKLLLMGAQARNPQALTILAEDLSFEPYAIVLPRGDWAFRLAVNTGLARIFRSREILDIFSRSFRDLDVRPSTLNGAVYLFGGLPE